MAINPSTIAELDPSVIKTNAEHLAILLKETYPSLDVSYGTALYQLLLYPAAVLHTINNNDLTKLDSNLSLSDVLADPETADIAAVDRLASNFMVTRREATQASGRVTLILTTDNMLPLLASTVFTASSGGQFRPTDSFIGTSVVVDPVRDRAIVPLADGSGNYSMTISVVAVSAGASAIVKDTTFTISPALSSLVSAYAEDDFVQGQDAESNTSVLSRISSGLAQPSTASRAATVALVKKVMPSTTDVSIIGYGDSEMLRDRGNIFGVSTGGKADIYARTAAAPSIGTYVINATVSDAAQGLMRINIYRNVLDNNGILIPWWFYNIRSIMPIGSTSLGSLDIVSDARGSDLTGADDVVPVFPDAISSAYTAFQTAAVLFKDPQAIGTTETTIPYQVTLAAMPGINDLQAAISSRQYRSPGSDVIVRAPIPCTVTAGVTVEYRSDKLILPDAASIKAAIVSAVNQIDFSTPRLAGSVIVNAINAAINSPYALVRQPIDLRGWLRKPDGTVVMLYGNDLIVPADYIQSVSRRTTAFFMRESDIDLTLTQMPYFQV